MQSDVAKPPDAPIRHSNGFPIAQTAETAAMKSTHVAAARRSLHANALAVRQFLYSEWPLFLLPVAALLAAAAYRNHIPLLAADSPDYENFSEVRPVGYPLFISFVQLFFGQISAVPYAQTAVLCASIAAIAIILRRAWTPLWLAVIFEAFVFANSGLLSESLRILSESLSATFIALFSAAVLLMAHRPNARKTIAMSIIAAAAITIRPVNVALVPAALLAILVFGGGNRKVQSALLILFAVCAFELTPAVHWLRNEPPSNGSPLARGLFQKTIFRQWPLTPELEKCDGQTISRTTAPIDAYLAQTPYDIRERVKLDVSTYIRFNILIPILVEEHHFKRKSEVDPIFMCFARVTFLDDPAYFVADAGRQFWYLLADYFYVTPAEYARIQNYLAAHRPPRFWDGAHPDSNSHVRGLGLLYLRTDNGLDVSSITSAIKTYSWAESYWITAFRFASVAAFLWGFWTLVRYRTQIAARSRFATKTYQAIGILGVAFFGEMGITAVVELAQPRYAFPVWSLSCLVLVLVYAAWRDPRIDSQEIPPGAQHEG
jgi:hypothetical protein